MSVSTKKNSQPHESSVLRELDDLMTYISDDNDAGLQEDLIDPSFFIGNIDDSDESEVPTLTFVAEDLAKPNAASQPQRQPGLFSNRVEELKRANEQLVPEPVEQADSPEINIDKLVDSLVEEHLPKIEAELRERIRAQLTTKK
jgi:hypothetical protein